MKIYRDVAFVSSVLLTIALLSLVPLSRQAFFLRDTLVRFTRMPIHAVKLNFTPGDTSAKRP